MKAFAKVSFSCAVDLFIFVRTGKQATGTAKIPVNASSLEYYVEMCVHPIWSLTLQGKNTYENCSVNQFGSRGICLSVQIRLLMTFGKIC